MNLLLFFLAIVFVQSNPLDCSEVNDGTFKMNHADQNGIMTSTILERKGDVQYEINQEQGVKLKFQVEWLDDCTYQLTLEEIISDKYNFGYPKEMIVTVKITEIHEGYYLQEFTTNMHDQVFEARVFRVD